MRGSHIISEQTKNTTRDRWLRQHQSGIGASEAAAAIGADPWRSQLALYLEKRGLIEPDDISAKPAVLLGTMLESPIRALVRDQLGAKIEYRGRYHMQRHPVDSWRFATLDGTFREPTASIDRLFTDHGLALNGSQPGLLEIKTTGSYNADQWEHAEEWPLHYQCQVQHAMDVAGLSWGIVAVFIIGWDFRCFPFVRDDRFLANLGMDEAAFWQRVLRGDEPRADDSAATAAALKKRYPKDDGETIVLPVEAADWDRELVDEKAKRKAADARIQALENLLKQALGSAAVGLIHGGAMYSYTTTKRAGYTVKPAEFRTLRRKAREAVL